MVCVGPGLETPNTGFLTMQLCMSTIMAHVRNIFDDDLGIIVYLSLVMRKPTFCISENKDADQLRGNHEADQRICFRFIDSTIPLLSKSEISSI